MEAHQFDVIIYGADVAGCAAAIFYARCGVRVGLVDTQSRAPQRIPPRLGLLTPAAHDFLQQLRLDGPDRFPARWALWARNRWLDLPAAGQFLNVPALRQELLSLAYYTSGVTWIPDACIQDLVVVDDTVRGIIVQQGPTPLKLLARLIIASDGPQSRLAQMAGLKAQVTPSGRFRYHAFYRCANDLKARLWLLDPDIVALLPHSPDLVEVICAPTSDQLVHFRADPQRRFTQHISQLTEVINPATPVSRIIGPFSTPATAHPQRRPGLAFLGTARFAADPLWNTAISWALPAAHTLVYSTVKAIMLTGEIEAGVHAYERQLRQQIEPQYRYLADLTTGRPLNRTESLALTAASQDDDAARRLQDFLLGSGSLRSVLKPDTLLRAAWNQVTDRSVKAVPVTSS
jgi:menaquinone-9 beta-reductase